MKTIVLFLLPATADPFAVGSIESSRNRSVITS